FCAGAIHVHKQRVSDVCRGREERILIQVIQGPCDAWAVFSPGHDQPFDLKMIGKCATKFRRPARCMGVGTWKCYDVHRASWVNLVRVSIYFSWGSNSEVSGE